MLRVAFGTLLVVICVAHPGFRDLIPNGYNVPNPCINLPFLWNAVGHNTSTGGRAPNVFGAVSNQLYSLMFSTHFEDKYNVCKI